MAENGKLYLMEVNDIRVIRDFFFHKHKCYAAEKPQLTTKITDDISLVASGLYLKGAWSHRCKECSISIDYQHIYEEKADDCHQYVRKNLHAILHRNNSLPTPCRRVAG